MTKRSNWPRRRRRRGISTIIGTLIFVLVLAIAFYTIFTIFGYYNTYNQELYQQSQKNQAFQETSVSLGNFSFGAPPVNVGSVTNSSSISAGDERRLFYDQGLWWLFFSNNNTVDYVTSPDGIVWSSPNFVTNSSAATSIETWQSGNYLYYALGFGNTSFAWRYGTFLGSGNVAWVIPQTEVPTSAPVDSVASISTDANGNLWIAVTENSSIQIWEYSSSSWLQVNDIATSYSLPAAILLPLGSGVVLVYGNGPSTAKVYVTDTTSNGNAWSTPVSPRSDYCLFFSSATAVGNELYFAGLASNASGSTSGSVEAWSYFLNDQSTSSESVLQSQISDWNVALSEFQERTLVVFYGTGSNLFMSYNFLGSDYWYPSQQLSNSETSLGSLSSTLSGSAVTWRSGGELRFAALPVVTAANNSPFAIHLVSLYVLNPSSQALVHFDANSSAPGVNGSFNYWVGEGEQETIPLVPFAWRGDQSYLLTLTTDQGVLVSSSFESPQ